MITRRYYRDYIKGTKHKEDITLDRGFLCNVKAIVQQLMHKELSKDGKSCGGRAVFLSSRALKHIHDRHIYEKNVPEDFEIILEKMTAIVKEPDFVYADMPEKRSSFLLIKKIDDRLFLIGIEVMKDDGLELEVGSAFVTGETYLAGKRKDGSRKFTLLWSREDG